MSLFYLTRRSRFLPGKDTFVNVRVPASVLQGAFHRTSIKTVNIVINLLVMSQNVRIHLPIDSAV